MSVTLPDHNKHQLPIPGGRYWENGKWVNANGESLDPEDIEKALKDQIAELTAKLDSVKPKSEAIEKK